MSWFNQGRFLIGLIQRLAPQPVTPMFPYVLLACCYVISHTLLLAIHGLQHSWKTHLGYLIFILFPTNWLSQEFAINVPGFGVGLALTCFCAYSTLRIHSRDCGYRFRIQSIAIILLLVLAIGGFQSLITLYLSIGLGSVLFNQYHTIRPQADSSTSRGMTQLLLPWLIYAALAIILHTLILKLYLLLSHSDVHQIDRYFRSPYFMLRTQAKSYILGNITQLLETYLRPGIFYGHRLWAFTALITGFPLVMLANESMRRQRQSDKRSRSSGSEELLTKIWPTQISIGLALLAMPLALNLISTPYRIPMRALMALPYLGWLAAALWLHARPAVPALCAGNHRLTVITGAFFSGVLICQCLLCTTSYYAARAYNFRSDQLVASTIVSALNQSPSTSKAEVYEFASMGALQRINPYPTAMYSTAGSSFFNWDGGSPGRIVAWLKAMGINTIKPATAAHYSKYKQVLLAMPTWPTPGSIDIVENTILVKFAD
ncbi:MAG: glucosyltransferase domain-containing protein [Cyanobium sp.]